MTAKYRVGDHVSYSADPNGTFPAGNGTVSQVFGGNNQGGNAGPYQASNAVVPGGNMGPPVKGGDSTVPGNNRGSGNFAGPNPGSPAPGTFAAGTGPGYTGPGNTGPNPGNNPAGSVYAGPGSNPTSSGPGSYTGQGTPTDPNRAYLTGNGPFTYKVARDSDAAVLNFTFLEADLTAV